MLHFEKLRWKNFLSTGNVFTEIHLDRSPSTVVVGENGAGKSTMLDALCWGLFNKPFRNIKLVQLINSINGKDARVEVEFRIGTTQYKIIRAYKPNLFEIWKDGELIPQPGNVRDYQSTLEDQILKLNYKSFTQVVILGSATFTPFMQLPVKDRREVIEDLLDIQVFSQMNTLLKDRVSKNKNDITDIEYKIELVENKIEVQQ
jgi:DNA repair exonuclease SbcCD ATPase subunit